MKIQKSLVDFNDYSSFQLKNKIKVLLIRNPMLTKTSCALSVKKGSMDEPMSTPGLSHFLEHMLFMGTSKYPKENDFGEFLSMNNGYTNAYTSNDCTVYICDADSHKTSELLDRFSSFFICPLFNEDSVMREINAVHSEYLNTLTSHEWRIDALLKEFMIVGSNEKRFTIGNESTLRKDGIISEVSEFYKNSYSSNIMNLVISSNLQFEELKEMAVVFNDIPLVSEDINTVSSKEDSEITNLFRIECTELLDNQFYDSKYFSRIIHFEPLEDKRELIITRIIPPMRKYYKQNPIGYIGFMLTNAEPGHFLSKLKAQKLGFGCSFTCDDSNNHSKITITVELTNLGATKYINVLNLLIDCINNIIIEQTEYNRLGRIQKEEFSYSSMENPLEYVERLCPNMYYYPFENLLNFSHLFEDFNFDFINLVRNEISDSSKWIILLANKNGAFEMTEGLYNIKYNFLDYSIPSLSSNRNLSNINSMNDEFLTNIEVFDKQTTHSSCQNFEDGRIIYVFESKYKVPKCEISIVLSPQDIYENEINYEIYIKLAEEHLNEKLGRILDNFHISIQFRIYNLKIYLKISGFSSKIIEVAELIMSEFWNIPLNNFSLVREELEAEYAEIIGRSSFKRMGNVIKNMIIGSRSIEEMLELVKGSRQEDLKFPEYCYTEIIAVGNILYEQVLRLFESVKRRPTPFSYKINTNINIVSFETNDKNSNLLGLFYKIVDYSEHFNYVNDVSILQESIVASNQSSNYINSVIGRFLLTIAQDSFFNELRTKEGLGYVASTSIIDCLSLQYLVFYVQSEKSIDFLEARINRFISDLILSIKNMDDDDFEGFRESLILFYDEPILSVEELSRFVVSQHNKLNFDLLIRQKYIAIAKTLTKDDILNSKILCSYNKIYSVKKEGVN